MKAVGYKEHQRFCELDGWTEMMTARGNSRDHIYYTKTLNDGRVLRTKISRGTDKKTYGAGMWNKVYKHELGLDSAEQFYEALKNRQPVDRTKDVEADTPAAADSLPAWLVQQLLHSAKMPEHEIAQLSEDDAMQAWNDFCTRPQMRPLKQQPAALAVSGRDPGYAHS